VTVGARAIAARTYWRLEAISLLVFVATLAAAGFRGSDALATLSNAGYSDPRASQIVGFLLVFSNVGLIVTPLLILTDAWFYGGLRTRVVAIINFLALLTIDLLIGQRYRAFIVVASALLIVHLIGRTQLRNGNVRGIAFVGVFLTIGVLFTFAAVRVSTARTRYSTTRDTNISDQIDLLTPGAAAVDNVDHAGLLYGQSYLDLVTGAVPSAVWHKPVPSTVRLTNAIADPNAGVALPLFVEAYANFGVLGVLVFSCFAGWLAAGAANHCRKEGGIIGIVGLALLPPLAVQLFSRGYAVQAAHTIICTYGAIVFLRWLGRRRPHQMRVRMSAAQKPDLALGS
jgi:oligosaccharide repeat unit polymerase